MSPCILWSIVIVAVTAFLISFKFREAFTLGVIDTYDKPIEHAEYDAKNPGLIQ